MNCSHCSHEFTSLRSATAGASVAVNGDLLICPKCGLLSIVEVGKTRPLLESEWNDLDEATQQDLSFALRNMVAHWKRHSDPTRRLILPPWLRLDSDGTTLIAPN